jgi:hypothetical protein
MLNLWSSLRGLGYASCCRWITLLNALARADAVESSPRIPGLALCAANDLCSHPSQWTELRIT